MSDWQRCDLSEREKDTQGAGKTECCGTNQCTAYCNHIQDQAIAKEARRIAEELSAVLTRMDEVGLEVGLSWQKPEYECDEGGRKYLMGQPGSIEVKVKRIQEH